MLALAESVLSESDTDLLWFLDTSVRVRVAAAEGADGMSVVECEGPPGHSPPLHIHHDEDEIFHVIEGVLRLRLGDRELRLAAGDTMLAPMGRPHTFRVESKGGARWQAITCNGSFEAFVREMSRPAKHGGLPPAIAPSADEQKALAAAAARHRIEIIGPPLA